MRPLTYQVTKTGRIHVRSGGRPLPEPWLFQPPPLAVRGALRRQLDPALVRAAWLLHRTRALPGHVLALRPLAAVARQVLADNAPLWPLVYRMIDEGYLAATPADTVVQRLKTLLCATDLDPNALFELNPYRCRVATKAASGRAKRNRAVRFWVDYGGYGQESSVCLTPAGWRYLQRQGVSWQRALRSNYTLVRLIPVLNLVGEHGLAPLPLELLEFVQTVAQDPRLPHGRESALAIVRALLDFDPKAAPPVLLARQLDALRDWWNEERPVIRKGTAWTTLVTRATDAALNREALARRELRELTWLSPVESFVSTQAMVVTPLVNGADLVDEGTEAENCLRNTRSYATRALLGLSQVLRLQGGQGRATVELTRPSVSQPWQVGQVKGPGNAEVTNRAVLQTVEEVLERANRPLTREEAA